jgi:cell shape-determining protein MreC
MRNLKLFLLKNKWYVYLIFSAIFIVLINIIFKGRNKKEEASVINFINGKKTKVFNDIIDIKINEIAATLDEIETLDEKIQEIEEIKSQVNEKNSLKSLRELSDAFKSLGY